MQSKFVFCSKGMKKIQTIKITINFFTIMLFILIMLLIFLQPDNAIVALLHLELLKK